MSTHKTTVVWLQTASDNSPRLRAEGHVVDVGLLCEAIIYYDQVIVIIERVSDFCSLLEWFIKQSALDAFLEMIKRAEIVICEHSFNKAIVRKKGEDLASLWHIQDTHQVEPNSFLRRYLRSDAVKKLLRNRSDRKKVREALYSRVREMKSGDFSNSIENARLDFENPRRLELITKSMFEELSPIMGWHSPPDVSVSVAKTGTGQNQISFNINNTPFESISEKLGKNLSFSINALLLASVKCNDIIWTAAKFDCDMYLGRPQSAIAGDKLYESFKKAQKIRGVIDDLQKEVEYPNIRRCVNDGKISFENILEIRSKARLFRTWLQTEGDKDRNAILAYHNEVAKDSGLVSLGRKTLRLFGAIGGSATVAVLKDTVSIETAVAAGTAASRGIQYLADLAAKHNEGWKPVVFGKWVRSRIESLSNE